MRQAGLSFKEIAKTQECSINTALGRMYDAVNHLRRNLSDLQVASA
jgi:DNA-directed RNA polymerase specialized sigma24 family protein